MNTEYGLGRIEAIDDRDARYRMASQIPDAASLRTYRYWTPQRPTLNQGATSSCVGQAWSQWAACGPLVNRGVDPYYLYHAAQLVDEWPGEDYDGTSVRAGAKVLQARGLVSSYVWGYDAATVAAFVLASGPVVMGTTWTHQMFYPDRNGYIVPEGQNVGGHAYLVTGVNVERGVFRCQNSWGPGWGQYGRFWILAEHLDRLIRDGGEACAAIEIEVAP